MGAQLGSLCLGLGIRGLWKARSSTDREGGIIASSLEPEVITELCINIL